MEDKAVVYFDGLCNLCTGIVQWVIRHDRKNRFLFASLQSDAGKMFLDTYNLPKSELTTFYLFEKNKIYSQSDAALRVAKSSGWKYSWLYAFNIVPRPLRDVVYDWVARNRYQWFGKREECLLPTAELRGKFL